MNCPSIPTVHNNFTIRNNISSLSFISDVLSYEVAANRFHALKLFED